MLAPLLTYFMVNGSRGGPALLKFFTEVFEGTLVRLRYRRDEYDPQTYASHRELLAGRLQESTDSPWKDSHSQRMVPPASALASYLPTGQLPLLPDPTSAGE